MDEQGDDHVDATGVSRRRVMKGAGLAAGALWVVPTVLSLDASSALASPAVNALFTSSPTSNLSLSDATSNVNASVTGLSIPNFATAPSGAGVVVAVAFSYAKDAGTPRITGGPWNGTQAPTTTATATTAADDKLRMALWVSTYTYATNPSYTMSSLVDSEGPGPAVGFVAFYPGKTGWSPNPPTFKRHNDGGSLTAISSLDVTTTAANQTVLLVVGEREGHKLNDAPVPGGYTERVKLWAGVATGVQPPASGPYPRRVTASLDDFVKVAPATFNIGNVAHDSVEAWFTVLLALTG